MDAADGDGFAMDELIPPAPPETLANHPKLAIERDPRGTCWCVTARNLGLHLDARLGQRAERLLRVRIAEAGACDDEDIPDVFGDYELLGDGVRFIPHFPFGSDVRFRAILDLGVLRQPSVSKMQFLEFSFPRETTLTATNVSQIFPSDDVLPENLLRLYVRFSNPMLRGRAADAIEIIGPDGRPVADVLYRAPVELWDRSMTCLTILLDPGRLKRGVGPNRILGPPLQVGQRYTLVIGRSMLDMCGRQLAETVAKSFCVSDAVREPIAIEEWQLLVPPIGSHEPLELRFPRPLNWAQLWHAITVVSEVRQSMRGRIDVDLGETRWRFTPAEAWQAGVHGVRVAPDLEDICGNTPYAPFDGPVQSVRESAIEKAARLIPFAVAAGRGRIRQSISGPRGEELV